MRNPNRYGSIVKLAGNRRRPFAVRLSIGLDDEGTMKYKYLDYYEKHQDAIKALAKYNEKPYDLAKKNLTFTDVYDRWTKQRYLDKDKAIPANYAAAYTASEALYKEVFSDLKATHLQKCLNDWQIGYASKKNMRILFGFLFKYAMSNDIVEKDYSAYVELPPQLQSRIHKPFSTDEIKLMWDNSADRAIQLVLIYTYTGVRPTELIRIKTEDVHLQDRYMIGGIKTEAGKLRAIPIAEKIYPFIEAWFNPSNDFLLTDHDGALNYDKMVIRFWNPAMNKLGFEHYPHDGRHTCATLLDNAGINKTIIKRILGHSSTGTTEKVYTHKTVEQLLEAINQI